MTYYLPDGKEYKGKVHKMADGKIHTGAIHTNTSKVLTTKKPIMRGGR
jgi:uncharacterized protein (DUF2147 family)